ncbi:hypothetical protein LCGC14_0401470 [marine sediment metagenome]|uniref:Putative DnaT-like domain-containing protein n=1 Tax=marine sediment metagenome TaxID=412755 RepID=A0A0F9T279_9ZZZZ
MATTPTTTPYATEAFADIYFGERLDSEAWDNAVAGNKEKALKQATHDIDNLNFVGSKTDPDQENEFPRRGDTTVPVEIQEACAEQAIALLEGLAIKKLHAKAGIVSERVGDASRSYGEAGRTKFLEENLGLSSQEALRKLYEWMVDPRDITLERV